MRRPLADAFKKANFRRLFVVFVLSFFYIGTGVVSSVSFKAELNALVNYPFVVSILNLVVGMINFGTAVSFSVSPKCTYLLHSQDLFMRRMLKKMHNDAPLKAFVPMAVMGVFVRSLIALHDV